MAIKLKFNQEFLLEQKNNDESKNSYLPISLELYEPLAKIDESLQYKITQTTDENTIINVIQSCPLNEKESLFEYLLFSTIKDYYPHLIIQVAKDLPFSYFNENTTIFILSHIKKNQHMPILEYMYPNFSHEQKSVVAEKMNHLILSQVFQRYELEEIQAQLDFIRKESIEYDEDIAKNYIQFYDSQNGLFITKFIDIHLKLHDVLSYFSNQGFNSYEKAYNAEIKSSYFNMRLSSKEQELLTKICGRNDLNSDQELLSELNKNQTIKKEKALLENSLVNQTNASTVKRKI
jgi:hypothetical protein